MNTNLFVLFVVLFLIVILVAIKVSDKPEDSDESKELENEQFVRGDLVEFIQEFDDGFHVFYLGEKAWVIEFANYNYVVISNKPDGYCATDGCDPFKFCTVPITILKKVIE